jgi:TRAP-type uncharacterized transport system fused permease subunit
MASVLATYVILFIFFGAFLQKSGAGKFFIDLPLALTGRSTGGPAKVAVVSSALFGSVSGSAIANTVSSGSFTIPMMKRAGIQAACGRSDRAGGLHRRYVPAADHGGGGLPDGGADRAALLPDHAPVGRPRLALLPVGLFMVHFEAKKQGLVGHPGEEVPHWKGAQGRLVLCLALDHHHGA